MTWHTVAYQANAAASAETTLTPIDDDVLQVNNNGFFSNSALQMVGSIGFGADLQYYKIETPSLNCLGYDFATQIIDSTGGNDQNADFPLRNDRPLLLKPREAIDVVGFQDNAGAQDITTLLLLSKGLIPAPGGEIVTIRGTSSTAATADGPLAHPRRARRAFAPWPATLG